MFLKAQPEAKSYVYQLVILNKLKGKALKVQRSLEPNSGWEELKKALIKHFGVKQTYQQLFKDAFAAENNSIKNYFKILRNILNKINEKFELDSEQPLEFSPLNADKIILKTFISNIDVNLASVILNKKIDRLSDAYSLLERENLIRDNTREKNYFNLRNEYAQTGVDNYEQNYNNGYIYNRDKSYTLKKIS